MTTPSSQVPWTQDQWSTVTQVIQEEAARARVAASFLDLHGPLPADTDFVRAHTISTGPSLSPPPPESLTIGDTDIIKLPTLQVKVYIRGAQMADPDLTSALALFRRSANVLARLEDSILINGQAAANLDPTLANTLSPNPLAGLEQIWQVLGGAPTRGLLPPLNAKGAPADPKKQWVDVSEPAAEPLGNRIVRGISDGIGRLEAAGHFAPFTVLLGQNLFTAVQTPNASSLVLPQDRILPFLAGGSLLRSSLLPCDKGLIVGLGGSPVEIVVATDVSLNFLQVTTDPRFVFRIYEKLALRIRHEDAILGIQGS